MATTKRLPDDATLDTRPVDESVPFPYVLNLNDGRSVLVELPPGCVGNSRHGGHVVFRPEAVAVLDRVRAAAEAVPDEPTPGRIRALRDALGLTQAALAGKLGVDKLTVSRWERGQVKPGKAAVTALRRIRSAATRRGVRVA